MKLKFFLFFVLCSLFFVRQTQAAVRYPIPELGNCRDAKECYYYCQIPKNTPSCWSYNKYVINKDVLGEEVVSPAEEAKKLGITFPVAELGNCNSPSECFVYCNQPQNQATCFAWAKKKGLVKQKPVEENIMEAAIKELGCKSELECMVFCQQLENMNKCQEFARRHNLVKEEHRDYGHQGPSPEIMAKAHTELGCDNEETCMKFCNKGDNMSKCMEFAKRHGMMEEEEYENHKGYMAKKGQMMEDAKKELGCVSHEACASFCSNPSNMEKCMGLARKYGMGGAGPSGRYIQYDQTGKNILPCSSPVECQAFCEKNINICSGGISVQSIPRQSPQYPQLQQYQEYQNQPSRFEYQKQTSENLAPGGCQTEAECKAYCQNNPEACPGFPKKPSGVKPSTLQNTSEFNSSNANPSIYPTKPSASNQNINPIQNTSPSPSTQSLPSNYQNYPQENSTDKTYPTQYLSR